LTRLNKACHCPQTATVFLEVMSLARWQCMKGHLYHDLSCVILSWCLPTLVTNCSQSSEPVIQVQPAPARTEVEFRLILTTSYALAPTSVNWELSDDCGLNSTWSTGKTPKSKLKSTFEHIEFIAKLLDYFLRSNKSNINESIKAWKNCRIHLAARLWPKMRN